MLRDAARREVFEETGLTAEPSELLGVYDRVLRDGGGNTLYHYVLIDFLCHRVRGEVQAGSDAAEVRWFRRDELATLNLAEDTAEVIRLGFEKMR
jgi:ADP-ribose pyrophosphatase YjhB (NUDIX family)